ncbi:MAG: hypothetical protein I8H71_11370 [Xanthomonadaceae bacterium]|nr:hypothetical protein [Xanthomonadaceae bacterium]
MFASIYRVLLALVGAALVVLFFTAIGWGYAFLVMFAVLVIALAWPLIKMVFGSPPAKR